MEAPGFITLLYIMYALPKELDISALPWGNWTMAALFVCLYLYFSSIPSLIHSTTDDPLRLPFPPLSLP